MESKTRYLNEIYQDANNMVRRSGKTARITTFYDDHKSVLRVYLEVGNERIRIDPKELREQAHIATFDEALVTNVD